MVPGARGSTTLLLQTRAVLKGKKAVTRALRAHTPRALHSAYHICVIMQLGHMLSTTFAYTYEVSLVHEQKAHA